MSSRGVVARACRFDGQNLMSHLPPALTCINNPFGYWRDPLFHYWLAGEALDSSSTFSRARLIESVCTRRPFSWIYKTASQQSIAPLWMLWHFIASLDCPVAFASYVSLIQFSFQFSFRVVSLILPLRQFQFWSIRVNCVTRLIA